MASGSSAELLASPLTVGAVVDLFIQRGRDQNFFAHLASIDPVNHKSVYEGFESKERVRLMLKYQKDKLLKERRKPDVVTILRAQPWLPHRPAPTSTRNMLPSPSISSSITSTPLRLVPSPPPLPTSPSSQNSAPLQDPGSPPTSPFQHAPTLQSQERSAPRRRATTPFCLQSSLLHRTAPRQSPPFVDPTHLPRPWQPSSLSSASSDCSTSTVPDRSHKARITVCESPDHEFLQQKLAESEHWRRQFQWDAAEQRQLARRQESELVKARAALAHADNALGVARQDLDALDNVNEDLDAEVVVLRARLAVDPTDRSRRATERETADTFRRMDQLYARQQAEGTKLSEFHAVLAQRQQELDISMAAADVREVHLRTREEALARDEALLMACKAPLPANSPFLVQGKKGVPYPPGMLAVAMKFMGLPMDATKVAAVIDFGIAAFAPSQAAYSPPKPRTIRRWNVAMLRISLTIMALLLLSATSTFLGVDLSSVNQQELGACMVVLTFADGTRVTVFQRKFYRRVLRCRTHLNCNTSFCTRYL